MAMITSNIHMQLTVFNVIEQHRDSIVHIGRSMLLD